MRAFWNARAREDALFFVDNRRAYRSATTATFWSEAPALIDHFLGGLGVTLAPTDDVLEIGCGVGRMTRVLADRARSRGRAGRLGRDARPGARAQPGADRCALGARRRRSRCRCCRAGQRRRVRLDRRSAARARRGDHPRLRARAGPRAAPRRLGGAAGLHRSRRCTAPGAACAAGSPRWPAARPAASATRPGWGSGHRGGAERAAGDAGPRGWTGVGRGHASTARCCCAGRPDPRPRWAGVRAGPASALGRRPRWAASVLGRRPRPRARACVAFPRRCCPARPRVVMARAAGGE